MGTIQKWNLAIVGATGQVGKELLSVLRCLASPSNSIRLLASRDSEGERTEDDERIEAFKKGASRRNRLGFPRCAFDCC